MPQQQRGTMTIREMAGLLNSDHVVVRLEKLTVVCKVKDMREAWNRVDVLITPVNGGGEQWVSVDRVIQS